MYELEKLGTELTHDPNSLYGDPNDRHRWALISHEQRWIEKLEVMGVNAKIKKMFNKAGQNLELKLKSTWFNLNWTIKSTFSDKKKVILSNILKGKAIPGSEEALSNWLFSAIVKTQKINDIIEFGKQYCLAESWRDARDATEWILKKDPNLKEKWYDSVIEGETLEENKEKLKKLFFEKISALSLRTS